MKIYKSPFSTMNKKNSPTKQVSVFMNQISSNRSNDDDDDDVFFFIPLSFQLDKIAKLFSSSNDKFIHTHH